MTVFFRLKCNSLLSRRTVLVWYRFWIYVGNECKFWPKMKCGSLEKEKHASELSKSAITDSAGVI